MIQEPVIDTRKNYRPISLINIGVKLLNRINTTMLYSEIQQKDHIS